VTFAACRLPEPICISAGLIWAWLHEQGDGQSVPQMPPFKMVWVDGKLNHKKILPACNPNRMSMRIDT
jgi:hypothetical protein